MRKAKQKGMDFTVGALVLLLASMVVSVPLLSVAPVMVALGLILAADAWQEIVALLPRKSPVIDEKEYNAAKVAEAQEAARAKAREAKERKERNNIRLNKEYKPRQVETLRPSPGHVPRHMENQGNEI